MGAEKVSENEKKVLYFLKNNDKITSSQVESLLNLKEARARRILKIMVEKKLVCSISSGKNTFYSIKEL